MFQENAPPTDDVSRLSRAPLSFEEIAATHLSESPDRRKREVVTLLVNLLEGTIPIPSTLDPHFFRVLREKYLPGAGNETIRTLSGHSLQGYASAGRGKISEALKPFGVSSEEIHWGFERVKYSRFLGEMKRWLRDSEQVPAEFAFQVSGSPVSIGVFNEVCARIGLGVLKIREGVLRPKWDKNLGYTIEVLHEGVIKHQFLVALPDGKLLTKHAAEPPNFFTQHYLMPANALLRLLWKIPPIELLAALKPREIHQYGSKRVTIFKGGVRSTFPPHVFLGTTTTDSFVTPVVRGEELLKGIKQVTLVGDRSKAPLATVTLEEEGSDGVTRTVAYPASAGPSVASTKKRNGALQSFIDGESEEVPLIPLLPLWSNSAKGSRLIGLGRAHINLPCTYPFDHVAVEVWQDKEKGTHAGLWPPGVKRRYNTPFKTATLLGDGKIKIEPASSWPVMGNIDPKLVSTAATHLLKDHTSPESRRLLTAFQKDPVLFYRTFLDPRPEHALRYQREAVHSLQESPFFALVMSSLHPSLAAAQARSWPYVLTVASLLCGKDPREVSGLAPYLDSSFALPSDPEKCLVFMSCFAPQVFRPVVEALFTHTSGEIRDILADASALRVWPCKDLRG